MKKPTRQQIKEAFNKTIERWERIVDDVDYFHESECALCLLESPNGENYVCSQLCPIRLHTKVSSGGCSKTPYPDFFRKKTPKNALVELNFLRKVYIWWMEEGEKDEKWESLTGYKRKEKKEEWVDITRELYWKIEFVTPYYYVGGYYKGERIVNLDMEGIWIPQFDGNKNFKTESEVRDFRILKKL